MTKTLMEKAGQMALMDAMKKGHTDKKELILYMQSKTFRVSVNNYYNMFVNEFS